MQMFLKLVFIIQYKKLNFISHIKNNKVNLILKLKFKFKKSIRKINTLLNKYKDEFEISSNEFFFN